MRRRNRGPNDLITAQEIASFAFCPESYRLRYGLGLEPDNRAALAAGERHHTRKALAERLAGSSIRLGKALVVVAMLLLGLLWIVWR